MIKHYEKYLSMLGVAVVALAMLGTIYFSFVTHYRHTPLAHALLGYNAENRTGQTTYASVAAAPLVLPEPNIQPDGNSGGCGCPFCCPAS